VPGVDDFRCAVLDVMTNVSTISYHGAVVSAYARSLRRGAHSDRRLATKFEEFLWLIERASDPVGAQRLLREI
jgi:hypothetical protein